MRFLNIMLALIICLLTFTTAQAEDAIDLNTKALLVFMKKADEKPKEITQPAVVNAKKKQFDLIPIRDSQGLITKIKIMEV